MVIWWQREKLKQIQLFGFKRQTAHFTHLKLQTMHIFYDQLIHYFHTRNDFIKPCSQVSSKKILVMITIMPF